MHLFSKPYLLIPAIRSNCSCFLALLFKQIDFLLSPRFLILSYQFQWACLSSSASFFLFQNTMHMIFLNYLTPHKCFYNRFKILDTQVSSFYNRFVILDTNLCTHVSVYNRAHANPKLGTKNLLTLYQELYRHILKIFLLGNFVFIN
jgi:hypothetical protein